MSFVIVYNAAQHSTFHLVYDIFIYYILVLSYFLIPGPATRRAATTGQAPDEIQRIKSEQALREIASQQVKIGACLRPNPLEVHSSPTLRRTLYDNNDNTNNASTTTTTTTTAAAAATAAAATTTTTTTTNNSNNDNRQVPHVLGGPRVCSGLRPRLL